LIRRLCLLREQAAEPEAVRRAENEFAAAVRDFRLAHGVEALPESDLEALVATEKSRVADALILSELLAPLLNASPRAAAASAVGNGQASPAPVRRATSPRPPTGESPAIPDLLDAMLAADRGRARPLSHQPH
jgi:hypothetical protein